MDDNLKGCFVYTSSAAACMPSPFAVTYASTKAFLSMFAISLAPEVKWMGIDVLAVHPSPVASRWVGCSCAVQMKGRVSRGSQTAG